LLVIIPQHCAPGGSIVLNVEAAAVAKDVMVYLRMFSVVQLGSG